MAVITKSDRQRLLQSIVFFATRTNHCGKIKLFKLLYLLDFEHFRQTGKSVTGLDYQAWKFGPVPIELMEEWESFNGDMERLIHIVDERIIDYCRETVEVNSGVRFDPDEFSKRQINIMEELSEKYGDARSPEMIDVVHAQNGAWYNVWRNGRGARSPIPYEMAIEDVPLPERDYLADVAHEQRMYRAALLASRQADVY